MNLRILGLAFLLLAAGCATTAPAPPTRLSGSISPQPAPEDAKGPLIGVIADSQLQTRGNFHNVFGYRGRREDKIVWVSMRPPAVDWAARAMLLGRLEELRARGVKAIFYLGDGANNGCEDELAAGFGLPGEAPMSNDDGLLTILDKFRRISQIPIYFVLGNHDLLGAGSTGDVKAREHFCDDLRPYRNNCWLTKFEVIALADRFNRGNVASDQWSYASSFDWVRTKDLCGSRLAQQHRRAGCYLAATLDYRANGATIQFLLVDTNDWANVTRSRLLWLQQEGIRGAMSFGELNGIESQTSWFERNARNPVEMRVALTHYTVDSLQKRIPIVGLISRKSQRFMNLFTDPATRRSNQNDAYVISAHTHTPRVDVHERPFRVGCSSSEPGCRVAHLRVAELNIGSTSDYSNYAAVVKLAPSHGAKGALHYEKLGADSGSCLGIWKDVEDHSFPNKLPLAAEGSNRGWAALAADRAHRHAYRRFGWEEAKAVWANLDSFAGREENGRAAECIGLYAAAIEYGIDPVTGRAFAPPPAQSHQPSGQDRYPSPGQ